MLIIGVNGIFGIFYYRMMNFDLSIVMYGDASFKHTLIKTRITVCLTRITACLTRITACLKCVSRVFEISVQLLLEQKTDSTHLSR